MDHHAVQASLGLARKLLAGAQLDGASPPPAAASDRRAGAGNGSASFQPHHQPPQPLLAHQLPAFLAASGSGGAQGELDGLLEALRSVARVPNADPPPFRLLQLLLLPEMDAHGLGAWWVVGEHKDATTGASPTATT